MPTFIPLKKKGLTAKMILGQTPTITHSRAESVRVTNLVYKRSVNSYRANTRSTRHDDGSPRTDSDTYVTTIAILDSQSHIAIDCTCAYHPYWGAEVALNLREAAQILRSNGRPPKIRNPDLRPWGCKHSVAVMKRLIALGKI